jgi:mannan endo-1,4-beta-mannosidase
MGDRPRLVRELDSLKAFGLTNLRVLGASEECTILHAVRPGIQISPGVLDENLLEGLDFLLAEMAKRDMYAVIYLNNYWEWSGGMAQYVAWVDGDLAADPSNPPGNWGPFMDSSATFYTKPKAVSLYNDYVRRIVNRRNTVDGRLYRDDPTIMAWQLANEPRPGRDNALGHAMLETFYHWVDTTARFIHALDPNHLVSTGSEGTVGLLISEEYFLKAHRTSAIDYLTLHLWPKNWGWFDPDRFRETLPPSETKALQYLIEHIGLARQLGKPIVMEEFGMSGDSARCSAGDPSTARDHYFSLILGTVYDSAKAGSPMAGTNIWTWGGEGRAAHPDFVWRKGDPFVGDPPQEPQGFNSIFLGDRSTLAIIESHAFKMIELGVRDTKLTEVRP